MTAPRLIVIGPLPPPVHGVTVSTSLVLASRALAEHFAVEHLDTSDHRSVENIGGWDVTNAVGALVAIGRLVGRLRGKRGVVYLPLSQSTPGLVRDSLFVLIAHSMGWRVAAHLRGSDFRSYYEASPHLWRRWLEFALRRVDSVAVMGESLRNVFNGLVAEDRITAVPNGTSEPRATAVARDPHHVLFLSNLLRRKGVIEAVGAARLVLDRFPAARFTFAGSWESDELEAEVRRLARSVNGGIKFTGPVYEEQKERLLATAAIFLFPPLEPEGHPRVVLEAMALGLPVVTTDRGAIRETVIHGESGHVLPDPDPAGLAQSLLTLLQDRKLMERMGRAARHRYRTKYTQDEADANLAQWLLSVAGDT